MVLSVRFIIGYTWQDDTTQEVISKELSQLPKVPLEGLTNTFSRFNGNSRWAPKSSVMFSIRDNNVFMETFVVVLLLIQF